MENKTHSSAANHIKNCGTVVVVLSSIGCVILVCFGFRTENEVTLSIGILTFSIGYFAYWFCRGFAELCEQTVCIRVAVENIDTNLLSSKAQNNTSTDSDPRLSEAQRARLMKDRGEDYDGKIQPNSLPKISDHSHS